MTTIAITRTDDRVTITIGKDTYTKEMNNEEFNRVQFLCQCYRRDKSPLNLETLKSIFNPYYHLLQSGFKVIQGQIFYKDLTLPLKGLLQRRIIDAFNQQNEYHFTSLMNFHAKCCNNKFVDNIDKLYEHIEANNFTITYEGDIITKKKAMVQTLLDLSQFKGFYFLGGKVKSKFGEVSQEEANEFLEAFNCSKVLASHSVNNNKKDKFYLTDVKTGIRTEHFDLCEYRLNFITEVDEDKCDMSGQSCAFSLHSTCNDDYINTFSGNIVLTMLLNPEWITNIPTSEVTSKLRSYKLQTIGIYDEETDREYLD